MTEVTGAPRWPMALASVAALTAALTLALAALPAGATAGEVYLEAMTSPEVAARVAGGANTILLPIGGTEQNGPHMVLGKHNRRVQLLAGRIAQQLGQTLVAPVLAYVPEGSIEPPVAHMRFAGTISIGEPAFEALLESAARSLRRHGFTEVVLLGDHGGYLKSLERVASRLNTEWAKRPASAAASAGQAPARVVALTEYYRASVDGHAELLRAKGIAPAEIGVHAGLADTSLSLALDPALVRPDKLQQAASAGAREGVTGDPRRASVELGQIGVDLVVARSVEAIRQQRQRR